MSFSANFSRGTEVGETSRVEEMVAEPIALFSSHNTWFSSIRLPQFIQNAMWHFSSPFPSLQLVSVVAMVVFGCFGLVECHV